MTRKTRKTALANRLHAAPAPVPSLQKLSLFRAILTDPDNPDHMLCYRLELPLGVSPGHVDAALQHVATKHRELTARFGLAPEGIAKSYTPGPVPFRALNLGAQSFQEWATAIARPHELEPARGPMIRAFFVSAGKEQTLFVQISHLVMDALSAPPLLRDFLDALDRLRNGQSLPAPEPDHCYAVYARRQRQDLTTLRQDPALTTQVQELARAATNRLDPLPDPQRLQRHLHGPAWSRIEAAARKHGASPAMVLTTAMADLALSVTELDRLTLSVFHANRNDPALISTVGLFAEPRLCAVRTSGKPLHSQLTEALAAPHVPLEFLLAMLRQAGIETREQAALGYINFVERIDTGGASVTAWEPPGEADQPSPYPIDARLYRQADGIEITLTLRWPNLRHSAAEEALDRSLDRLLA